MPAASNVATFAAAINYAVPKLTGFVSDEYSAQYGAEGGSKQGGKTTHHARNGSDHRRFFIHFVPQRHYAALPAAPPAGRSRRVVNRHL